MNWNYLLGFLEADGNVNVAILYDKSYKFDYRVATSMTFTQRHNGVLLDIQKFLSENNIHSSIRTSKSFRPNDSTSLLGLSYSLNLYSAESIISLGNILNKMEWHTKKKEYFDAVYKFTKMKYDLIPIKKKLMSKRQTYEKLLTYNEMVQYRTFFYEVDKFTTNRDKKTILSGRKKAGVKRKHFFNYDEFKINVEKLAING